MKGESGLVADLKMLQIHKPNTLKSLLSHSNIALAICIVEVF